ncbi:VOC family protein [Streptomyces ardesiacus]|uniref:VOC family protein n=1 Tax=Streptomyces ardesiacus TaxID=285564 RepID=UPI0013C00CE4|nr:VOC family protein [Streptomyces ardesiacus]MCL7366668.1 VOC family protein [Streptomyces ardesiacus]NEB64992.1 VOC family protein [Streptomyces diastaticus]
MTSQLSAICFTTSLPARLARFWAGVLDWESAAGPEGDVAVLPPEGTGYRIRFVPGRAPKTVQNRAHFDLTSTSPEEQRRTVARALHLGGKHIDVGQRPEEGHVVLADPDGNEFCVLPAGNAFLAGIGPVGALACDGTQEVGYFWSEALRWPLVWDQDQETAVQSPAGGTKITWGGPPVAPQSGVNRLRLELAVPADADFPAEIDRLLALGATRAGGERAGGGAFLLDPDGNEFTVHRLG